MLSSAETQWAVLVWAGLLVLVSLFVVAAVLALNSTVTALQRGAARAKLNAPPTQPFRDVDGAASGDQLAQQTQCPRTPPSGLVTRVGGSIQPFIVLHELHAGELWLVKLLQARTGVRVLVGQAKDGKAQKAAHEWLSAVMSAASPRGGTEPGRDAHANATASSAVGLLLTPRAARSLNLTTRLEVAAAQRGAGITLPAPALISLSRRNRLKHALSRYVRGRPSLRLQQRQQLDHGGPGPGGQPQPGVRVQPASLLKLLDMGRAAFAELHCTAGALEASLSPPPAAAAAVPRSPSLLRLYYEDLLYATPRTSVRLWRHLRLDPAADAQAAQAVAMQAGAAKTAPNSLCRAVANYGELCAALRGTAWEADLLPPGPGAAGRAAKARCLACAPRTVGLVLGGSHHKTGTLLLERLLQSVGAELGLPVEKPHWERCASLQRREDGICVDEHASVPKLHRFFFGARYHAAALVHIVREPLEVCVSSYQYHLRSTEAWLRMPRKELHGKSWQAALKAASTRDGLLLECRRSIRDQVRQQAEVFNATRRHPRVLTLRMEELESGFDPAVTRLLRFLLSGHELPRNVSEAMLPRLLAASAQFDVTRHRGELDDGHLSPRQRKAQLRAILLNDTGLAAQLTSWRRAAGYDASFAAHCARYGFKYHEESAAILGSTGPGMGGPMRLRV